MAIRRTFLALIACALALCTAAPALADVVDDNPAAATQGNGDMRVFVRGRDAALWTRSWNGSAWSGWSSLGGVLTSGPAAMARPGGIYDVFVRGVDNGFYHIAFTPAGGWTPWAPLGGGGVFSSGPGATYRQGSGEVDVFGAGTDRQLYHSYYSGGWSAWEALGGGLNGAPSAISPASSALEVYVRGTDNQLYEKYWTPSSGWVNYIALGGALTSAPAATAWDGNRRDVFVRGPDGVIYDRSWTSSGGWLDYGRLAGATTSGAGATSPGPGRLQLFARTGDALIAQGFASTWTGWQAFGSLPPTPPAPPPPPPALPPSREAQLRLNAGFGCIPQGGRVPVRVRIRERTARLRPHIIKVVFFIDRGKRRRVDHHSPYKTRMRVTYRRGTKHRVHARIYFRRTGSKRVQRKTVSKRFTMCK